MSDILQNISLKPFNTLQLDVQAAYFFELTAEEQLPALMAFVADKNLPFLVLGGGSNVILSGDFPGLVIHNQLQGVSVVEANGSVSVSVAAGENWHDLVMHLLEQGVYGLENLALIPGTAGAAPIQNIGAYGVELEQFVESVRGWDISARSFRHIEHAGCEFAYRDSIFKHSLKQRFIITEIRLRLTRLAQVHITYPALQQRLQVMGIDKPSPQQIADAVIHVRQQKLPAPERLPNVGSFFKNPVVSTAIADELRLKMPDLVSFPLANDMVKLAAGWLLEKAGWKGRQVDALAMYQEQALVMVNHGGASSGDVLALAQAIQEDVATKFGVALEIEPVVV